jgi:hypothetical protein
MKPRNTEPRRKPIQVVCLSNKCDAFKAVKSPSAFGSIATLARIPTPRPTVAITEINAAIGEIKKASIDDGKNLDDHPNVDVSEHGSRLLRSMEALKKARADIAGEEDNPEVRDLRHRAFDHIDRALSAASKAHIAWLKDMGK